MSAMSVCAIDLQDVGGDGTTQTDGVAAALALSNDQACRHAPWTAEMYVNA